MPSAAKALRSAPHWVAYFHNNAHPRARALEWHHTFVDLLSLYRVTAAAFSPAEAQPRTSRAMLRLTLENIISRTTIGGWPGHCKDFSVCCPYGSTLAGWFHLPSIIPTAHGCWDLVRLEVRVNDACDRNFKT